jgi:hypothetical protein
MCDILDQLTEEDLRQSNYPPIDTDPHRNDAYPEDSDDPKFAIRIMQFPQRFRNLWVLKPVEEISDYSKIFTLSRKIKYNGVVIRSNVSRVDNKLIPDRPYNWFVNAFLGTEDKEPLFPLLDIKGIDIDLSTIDEILAEGDIHFVDLWSCQHLDEKIVFAKQDLPLWLSFLKSNIPVEIVDEVKMEKIAPSVVKGLIRRNPDDTIENMSEVMETLGCYYSCEPSNSKDLAKPKIYMCLDRIKKVADEMSIKVEDLFAIVYIHELAHAAMDPTNDVHEDEYYLYDLIKNSIKPFKFDSNSEFMEESLANMIMLKYIEWYSEATEDQSLFDVAITFVGQQAPIYRFGKAQLKLDTDWTKWRVYKCEHME